MACCCCRIGDLSRAPSDRLQHLTDIVVFRWHVDQNSFGNRMVEIVLAKKCCQCLCRRARKPTCRKMRAIAKCHFTEIMARLTQVVPPVSTATTTSRSSPRALSMCCFSCTWRSDWIWIAMNAAFSARRAQNCRHGVAKRTNDFLLPTLQKQAAGKGRSLPRNLPLSIKPTHGAEQRLIWCSS